MHTLADHLPQFKLATLGELLPIICNHFLPDIQYVLHLVSLYHAAIDAASHGLILRVIQFVLFEYRDLNNEAKSFYGTNYLMGLNSASHEWCWE